MSLEPYGEEREPVHLNGHPLRRLRQWAATTPTGAFLVITPAIVLAEFLGMWAVERGFAEAHLWEAWANTAVSLLVLGPIVYFLFVLPTARNLRRRIRSEQALLRARDDLEMRVRERTAEVEEANRRLRAEMDERLSAQHAMQFQASLLDAVEQAVITTDPEGRIRYWNRFAEGLYGWRRTEVEGRPLTDVVAFGPLPGHDAAPLERCRGQSSWTGEVDALRRNGSRFPAHLNCSPLSHPLDDGSTGYVFLSFDISDRKAAEEALRHSEEKYSTLVESSPTGIFIVQDGLLAFVNRQFAEMLDESCNELIGCELLLLLHPDDRDALRPITEPNEQTNAVAAEAECRLVTGTGQLRWVTVRHTPIRYRGGVVTLGNVQDVTDHRRMEAALRSLSARLLGVQEEERRRVARDLHDSIGQTLGAIKFSLEAALGRPWPEERRANMATLRSLVPMLQAAVKEVRRLSTDLRPPILDDLGLLPTMAWHLRDFQHTYRHIAVASEWAAAEAEIPPGLKTPIFRILQEATHNVAKHSRAHRLTVRLAIDDNDLRLTIGDDGTGFDPASPYPDAGEWGSGLSSMRERTELTGGSFSVRSAPGDGTTIEAVWPLRRHPVSG